MICHPQTLHHVYVLQNIHRIRSLFRFYESPIRYLMPVDFHLYSMWFSRTPWFGHGTGCQWDGWAAGRAMKYLCVFKKPVLVLAGNAETLSNSQAINATVVWWQFPAIANQFESRPPSMSVAESLAKSGFLNTVYDRIDLTTETENWQDALHYLRLSKVSQVAETTASLNSVTSPQSFVLNTKKMSTSASN